MTYQILRCPSRCRVPRIYDITTWQDSPEWTVMSFRCECSKVPTLFEETV